jgi:MoxR-like ATPase
MSLASLRELAKGAPAELIASVLSSDISHIVKVPAIDPNFHFPGPEFTKGGLDGEGFVPVRTSFSAASELYKEGGNLNMCFTGPSGVGKTATARQFAAVMGLPFLRVDCSSVRDASAWFGRTRAADGSVFWSPSIFFRAIRGGNCVILLDEINRANPAVLNALLSLMDDQGEVVIEDADILLQRGKGVIMISAANIGNQYTGTNRMDPALFNRQTLVVEFSWPDENTEKGIILNFFENPDDVFVQKTADTIVRIMGALRQRLPEMGITNIDMGIRHTRTMAQLVSQTGKNAGSTAFTVEQAARVVLSPNMPIEQRATLEQIISSQV